MKKVGRDVASVVPSMCQDERGISFMVMMIIVLLTGVLGVAALTMTGLENSMAGAIRMVEEGTHAAESCIGTAVNVIQQSIDVGMPPNLIAPQGPVPALNVATLVQEISGGFVNNPDVAVGAGSNPNLVMTVNNYIVNGDIDFLFRKWKSGSNSITSGGYDAETAVDLYYRVDCTAANAATGATSRVIAVYDCLAAGDGCTRRTY